MKSLAKLGDVCEIIPGRHIVESNHNRERRGVPYLTGPSDFGQLQATATRWTEHPDAMCRPFDVLVVVKGAGVANTNLAPDEPACIGRQLMAVRAKPSIADATYVSFAIYHAKQRLKQQAKGATVPGLSIEDLEELELPFRPLAEQKVIAGRLSKQLSEVETARQAIQIEVTETKFLAIRVKEVAQEQLRTADPVILGDLLLNVEAGKSFQTTERIAGDKELGVLKVSAVSWSEFDPKEAKGISSSYAPDDRNRVRKGDVIISRANTVELVGAVVRADRDYPNRLLSDKTLRLVLDEQRCDPDYIVQILRLPEARAHIEAKATGTSDSMRNITQDTIRATPIALPGIDEQRRIAAMLRQADEAIRSAQAAMRVQLDEFAALSNRLLAQVFDN